MPQPYVVDPFVMPEEVKKIRNAEELEMFVEKHTDEFAFKNALFNKQAFHS